MEHHARLQARIATLRELRDLVRMMRGLAGARLQQAEEALGGIQRYAEIIEASIGRAAVLASPDGIGDVAGGEVPRNDVLIVVGSEHGFVGGFNDRLVDRARELVADGRKIGIIGRRVRTLAQERGLPVEWFFPMATHVGGVLSTTYRVADHLAGVATADVLFGRHGRAGSWEIQLRPVLPLDPSLLQAADEGPLPLHHLPPPLLLEYLAREYLFAEISRAVTESMAAENAVRLRVMESAGESIDDKVEGLTRQEQNLRQQEITTEMLDVVTGASAVLGDGGPGSFR